MGGFLSFGSSESKATDARVAGADQARIASGQKALLTESGAVALAEKARLNTGLDLSSSEVKGNLTFNVSDGADNILALNKDWLDALKRQTDSANTAVAAASTLNADVLDKVLSSVKGLAETKATDGDNLKLKYLFWTGLVTLAVAALVFIFRRS